MKKFEYFFSKCKKPLDKHECTILFARAIKNTPTVYTVFIINENNHY